MSYSFGTRSTNQLDTCHEDLQKIHQLAITRSRVDYGISEGHRTVERQKQLYDEGKSQIDGITRKGMHNYEPSLATDIFAYHPDLEIRRKIVYDKGTLCYLAGVIISCAFELFEKGEITHKLRWGGNWDRDGIILYDQSFDDLVHFEIY